jgi:hypothetical protein
VRTAAAWSGGFGQGIGSASAAVVIIIAEINVKVFSTVVTPPTSIIEEFHIAMSCAHSIAASHL